MSISVSIIIPAHNAEETLSTPLKSLECQTCSDWEAIIVDDGSTDDTSAIASEYARQDSRVQIIAQSQQGVSAARNTGAQIAQNDWLLFLDADDWVAPDYLETFIAHISLNPADVVHCGWVRIAEDGSRMPVQGRPQDSDLFPILTQYCPFAMHSCLVKRAVFADIGGFDITLKTCEDWDLWQRIARQGHTFSGLPNILAFYQMRAGSLSRNAEQFLQDGLRILAQGRCSDDRVPRPLEGYKNGLQPNNADHFPYYFTAWASGLRIGAGEDTSSFIQYLQEVAPGLIPDQIAGALFESVLLPTCSPIDQWWSLWPRIQESLGVFLKGLEVQSQTIGLAKRVLICLERCIIEKTHTPLPIQVGETYGIQVDIFSPWVDHRCPNSVERLICKVVMAEQELGYIELPICNEHISPLVIRDQIAAKFWWQILGHFLEKTHYQSAEVHDQQGWLAFLRALWNRPKWSNARFYNTLIPDWTASTVHAEQDQIEIEILDPLPNILVKGSSLQMDVTLAGVGIGQVIIPTQKRKISAQQIRVALTLECGMELGRVVVREALISRPIQSKDSIRNRLVDILQQRDLESSLPVLDSALSVHVDHSTLFALGQRGSTFGNSDSRWAILPIEAVEDMIAMTRITQEPVAHTSSSPTAAPQLAIYAPSLVSSQSKDDAQFAPQLIAATRDNDSISRPVCNETGHNNRQHFESIFATGENPWRYTTDYEQTKYDQTLSLLPDCTINKALELACAEGHFTQLLADQVESLIATDISQIAVERTAQRCTHLSNVQCQQLDMAIDPFPVPLDLIVCSEVLYYIGDRNMLQKFAQKVATALNSGGYFLTAHAHLVVDEPSKPGFNWNHPFGAKGISDAFQQVKTLSLIQELHTPLYRIQLFQKRAKPILLPWERPRPIRTVMEQPTAPPERVADTVLWKGGSPKRDTHENITTHKLPILTYHRILPTEESPTQDWYLNADVFEAQLRYLRDAGYHSISLDDWQTAVLTQKPISGRAVVLTFDDGYLDFYTQAYPLLKEYGFSATVFLVANSIGQSNQWDAHYGEPVPLMDWSQILQLQAEGIEFGSHTSNHRPLTGLMPTEIVQEGARSRMILTQKLGHPVRSIAYPYGDTDPVVAHLMGACGYTMGVTCRSDISRMHDDLLSLPRLEVNSSDRLQDFVRLLNRQEEKSS